MSLDTETHREERQVTTEAEMGVRHLQASEWQGRPPEARRGMKQLLGASKRKQL